MENTFQSTPPCGGDRLILILSPNVIYFNPRPLAGATELASTFVEKIQISIHAPLRGRRRRKSKNDRDVFISIHAPLRGRRETGAVKGGQNHISIHAPLRGRR